MSNETESEAPETAADWGTPEERALGESLLVEVDGYEGPLDLLLALARTQKVDLAKISILALVEQYLAYIAEASRLRLELAADYLVMAAWLAYLKSKLLLPRQDTPGDEPNGEELAARLAFRLMRLEAMRSAAAQLFTRRRLGRDVFARGMPEGVRTIRERQHTAEIFDLLAAYAEHKKRTVKLTPHVVKQRKVWSIKEARRRLEAMVGKGAGNWQQLDLFLTEYLDTPELSKTAIASSFGASLEMAREGHIELRQERHFGPIYVRKKEAGAAWEVVG